jgi:hypothetical protein
MLLLIIGPLIFLVLVSFGVRCERVQLRPGRFTGLQKFRSKRPKSAAMPSATSRLAEDHPSSCCTRLELNSIYLKSSYHSFRTRSRSTRSTTQDAAFRTFPRPTMAPSCSSKPLTQAYTDTRAPLGLFLSWPVLGVTLSEDQMNPTEWPLVLRCLAVSRHVLEPPQQPKR